MAKRKKAQKDKHRSTKHYTKKGKIWLDPLPV